MKRSKSLPKSQNGQNERPEPPRPPQKWSDDDDEKSKMLERRQNQARGEEICQKCGGVLWPCGKCGDCGPWNNKGVITP